MREARSRKARISIATPEDRQAIYRLRHAVYAEELGQYKATPDGMLTDALDAFNEYIVAQVDGELVGFISITPPGFGKYSIDKYVAREDLTLAFDDGLYELRALTVAREHRSSRLAAALMYAAFRWAEEQGARHFVAMGRTDVVSLYLKQNLQPMNRQIRAGAVDFELLQASVGQMREHVERHHRFYKRLQQDVAWETGFPFFKETCCFHGGAFFDAIGTEFDALERRDAIVNADVLDAWFPPAPGVIETLQEHLPWLMRTSPPTPSDGLRRAIARARGVDEENVLPGAGSSSLIYLAFREWLDRNSRVLILDPMYGEYAHVLEKVIGCKVDRLTLAREDGYAVDLDELRARTQMGYDLIVLVNPNNPTGRHIARGELERVLRQVPASTRVWIDEAYLEYAGAGESVERFAARSANVVVCKSMSKVYGLSGMRVAYLCGPMHLLSALARITPPWAVGLPAQVAAVRALAEEPYYAARYRETHCLRAELVAGLRRIGIEEIVPGTANFVMFHLEQHHPEAAAVLRECREMGVFLRDPSLMGSEVGGRALRTAVKDRATNAIVIGALERSLCGGLEVEMETLVEVAQG